MNIKKYTYRLNESNLVHLDINDIDSIALHHMAHATANINDVTNWHMDDNNWDWIGYGYWIGFDGTIYECRGYKYLNAGVKNHNSHVVSIGFQGDYRKKTSMSLAQFNSGVQLIRYLKSKLKTRVIDGHRYWTDTDCPGTYFPVADIIKNVEAINLNIEEAKQVLLEEGIINSKEYWEKVVDTTLHFDKFVINAATKIKELKAAVK